MSEWCGGGYFLMGSVEEAAIGDVRLPRPLWSMSTCVSDSYPDHLYLDWVEASSEDRERMARVLDLSPGGLDELRGEVSRLFEEGVFRWPNVFGSVAAARDFHARWLTHLDDVRLLGISLPIGDVAHYLEEIASDANPEDGVRTLLSEGCSWEDGEPWGFEVLGSDFGAFHTYLCHGMATELMEGHHVRFNERGLIGAWEDALRVAEWINSDDVGAEPVPWRAWRVDRYTLTPS